MELRMNEVQLPEKITFNYEELKQELTEKVSMYEALVYTDENIKDAKADRANLNKLKKALNDERIRREKEYMVPFNEFKSQINEIIGIIDKPVAVIDAQVKAYEDKQKQEKKAAIEELFGTIGFQSFVTLDMIFDEKWLNASVSMKSIEEQMKEMMYKFSTDLLTLNNLPEFGFEAVEVYKSTLDINKAINEAQRMSQIAKAKAEREAEQARLKSEEEARKATEEFATGGVIAGTVTAEAIVGEKVVPLAEIPVEVPAKQWVSFRCLLKVEDAQALGEFFRARQIEFEQI